jgi:putative hydrolase of HD superfamily
MIKKELFERFFEAANMQRWNDHIKPVELTELDKQSHKIVLAYVIAKFEEEDRNIKINWQSLIEGSIFEFLYRTVLTDIKPPVFHKIKQEKEKQLNEHVLKKLTPEMEGLNPEFIKNFKKYLDEPYYSNVEKRILKAAHYLATNWEFKIIYHNAPFIYGIDKTKEAIENQIEDHYDLIGVQKIMLGKKSYGFIDLCGQLRFQKRWAHSPRVPKTSVLGHMYIVAILSFLLSLQVNACNKRMYNNFFAGLFHDIPEVLTKDIISPVKKSVEGLEDIIKEYENLQMEEVLLPLIPTAWGQEMKYFTKNEFDNKIKDKKHGISSEDMNKKYNEDKYNPVDGEIIEVCDQLAAFIEATLSINYGITSKHLEQGRKSILDKYGTKKIAGIDFKKMFEYFEEN